jgi:hypothetical protein
MMIQRAARAAVAALAVGIGSACSSVPSSDASDLIDDEPAMLQAGFGLGDAIAVAEQQTGGRAVEAGFDDDTGPALISIVLAHPDRVQRVLIDPKTGKVVEMATGRGDDDDDCEAADD